MVRDSDFRGDGQAEPEYDKVTQASLNGIYVKAQELDRGHNAVAAPTAAPPGVEADASTHASTHASESDAATHASTHASAQESDATTHASDE